MFAAGWPYEVKPTLPFGIVASAVPTSERPVQVAKGSDEASFHKGQIHAHLMVEAVQGFNEQLERLAELGVVMIVGAMLSYVALPNSAIWFLPLILLPYYPAGRCMADAERCRRLQGAAQADWLARYLWHRFGVLPDLCHQPL